MAKTDKEIIQAIRNGKDDEAIASLYKDVLPNIQRHICANSGTKDDAFDVFQEALLVLFKLVVTSAFQQDKYKIHGFLYTISKNLWINQVRKRSNGTKWQKYKMEEENEEETILNFIISDEKSKLLERVFNSLGDKCVELLNLSIYQKMSMKEIAEKLNLVSENAAKVKTHRCRKMLSDKVKSDPFLTEQLSN